MNWLIVAIFSALSYATSNAITKVFQPKFSSGVGMFIFSTGVFLTSILFALVIKPAGATPKFSWGPASVALASGFVWAFAQLFFIVTLSKNAPLSVAVPFILGGISVGGAITGALFFGETLTISRIIGITAILIGTVILSK